jgi:hypothetical protein
VCCRAAFPDAVAEDHVDLFGLIQPHRDLEGEQVAAVEDLLAGVLNLPDHTDSGGAALGQDGLQRRVGSLAQPGVRLVSDHVS